MARNRRDRRNPNQIVVHITARVFEGLPFAPRRVIRRTLRGILARGQCLFQVSICAFIFMGNHHHFILAGNGNRISPFMNYVQGELAKAFARYIPTQYQHKFWEGRFHEQRLFTPDDVISKLIYVFMNPVVAGLCSRPENYDGLSSFQEFVTSSNSKSLCSWTPVRFLKKLNSYYGASQDVADEKSLISKTQSFHDLVIEPLCWLKCFGIEKQKDQIHQKILKILSEVIEKQVLLVQREEVDLKKRRLDKPFIPKKKTRTPYILCADKSLRLLLILEYKDFCERCRDAWQKLKEGALVLWPIGAYRPYHGWAALRS